MTEDGRHVVLLANTISTPNSFPPQRTETVSLGSRHERNRCGSSIVEVVLDNGNQELSSRFWCQLASSAQHTDFSTNFAAYCVNVLCPSQAVVYNNT